MQEGNQGEPGWVFKPGDATQSKENIPDVGVLAVAAANEPAPTPSQTLDSPAVNTDAADDQFDLDAPHVEWTASEYVANPKNAGWFIMLAFASAVVATVVYLVTRDVVSTVVIAILGLVVGIFSARQPKVLRYAIDSAGIHIEQRFYPYESFKTFSVADSQPIHYISLTPLRRFMPPLIIHYDPDDEERIVNTLAEYLPYEEHKPDMVDNISRRVRF